MAEPSLVIRADASHQMGIGHVMRCVAIAQGWLDKAGHVTFIAAEIPESLNKRLKSEGFHVAKLDVAPGTAEDAAQTILIAQQQSAAAVILDGYQFGTQYHEAVCATQLVTLAIDDYGHLPFYPTDFVLNQNLGADQRMYPSRANATELLLGTKYALLRREFLRPFNQRSAPMPTGGRVLVTLGGSDPDNVTQTVVEGLKLANRDDMDVRVILGGSNRHYDQLAGRISDTPGFSLLRDVQDMAAQYDWAELAIAAGGSSNWEMCYFGLPRIVLVIAPNQKAIAEELERAQVAINLGVAEALTSQRVCQAVEELFSRPAHMEAMRSASLKLVDGLGASRCVSHLRNRIASVATLAEGKADP